MEPWEPGIEWPPFGPTFPGGDSTSAFPSAIPNAAIHALRFVEDSVIKTNLLKARYSGPFRPLAFEGPLSRQQIQAICSLKHCPDADIFNWLRDARAIGEWQMSQPQALVLLVNAYLHVSTGTVESVEPDEANNTLKQTPTFIPEPRNRYWCTVCTVRRSYQNRDDWRKHEKEHEETYKCTLGGLEQVSAVTADASNNPQPSLCASSRKRRDGMVEHLRKSHGLGDKIKALELANKCRVTSGKKFWSCGFCIYLTPSHRDRLGHLSKHFEQRYTLDQWHLSTEIQGLLRQPQVVQAWDSLLAARHCQHGPGISWQGNDDVSRLKAELQMGPSKSKSAQCIAETACALSSESQNPFDLDLRRSTRDGSGVTVGEAQLQPPIMPTDFPRVLNDQEYQSAVSNSLGPNTFSNGLIEQTRDDIFNPFTDHLLSDLD